MESDFCFSSADDEDRGEDGIMKVQTLFQSLSSSVKSWTNNIAWDWIPTLSSEASLPKVSKS